MARIATILPEGRPLAPEIWERRHRGIVLLVWLHAAGLFFASVLINESHGLIDGVFGGMLLAVLAILADRPQFSRRLRASLASLALLSASAILVHLTGGVIEMHFHFFVALGIIALYQEWLPFLVAIGFVLVEHGVVGVFNPAAVYNHPSAIEHPWLWAGIHAAFVSAASMANLLAWRLSEQQALHDPLTRLANRTLFSDRAEQAQLRARRHREPIAIVFVDLDRFKPVNDTFGHDAGDRVLVTIADRLRSSVRAGDTVARLGGDEFAILIDGMDDPTEATRIARRISETLREPIVLRGGPVTIRASLGIAVGGPDTEDVDGLIRDADVAMYIAKSRGGGRYEVFDPSMRVAVAERLELELELRDAVDRGEMQVHYQPTVSLSQNKVAGVEALLRWQHPTRGPITPGVFVPIAEETRLIIGLGRWVLEEACRQAHAWHTAFPMHHALQMSVNVSAVQLTTEGFAHDVGRILRASGVAPATITLEITESALMDDADGTAKVLADLKALGVRLAIDDFGTGYSSLNYLQRMPVDVLKIDRSFVDGLERGGEALAFARAICDLARSLSLQTIAEGIELTAQADRLGELGCDLGQGFLYAKALPPDQLAQLLEDVYPIERAS
jgi:diguanylate cyclase (GGDEF)-like protein